MNMKQMQALKKALEDIEELKSKVSELQEQVKRKKPGPKRKSIVDVNRFAD